MGTRTRKAIYGVSVSVSKVSNPLFSFYKTPEERDQEFDRILKERTFYVIEKDSYEQVAIASKINMEPTVYFLDKAGETLG